MPVAGGFYDQHPEFVRKCNVIFEARGKKYQEEEKKRQFEMGRGSRGSGKVAGRRHR